MAYEQTEVPVARSQEAIRRLILHNGGTGVAFISQPPMEGFEAYVGIGGKMYKIRLQAECKADIKKRRRRWGRSPQPPPAGSEFSVLHLEHCRRWGRSPQPPPAGPFEKDCRRIWRVLYHQMKSIYESSATGVVEFRRLVLAFIVTKDGMTVGDHILPKLDAAIEGRPERMLPAAHVDAEIVE